MKKVLLVLLFGCNMHKDDPTPANMGSYEAAAWAAELAGEWMQCWGDEINDFGQVRTAFLCSPGPGKQVPLVSCYRGRCRLVRWSGQICFPPSK